MKELPQPPGWRSDFNEPLTQSELKMLYGIDEIQDMIDYAKHIHVNDQSGTDICKLCKHDLRHAIHKRQF